ncbi:MAG: type II toxin-antitoxin system RelE/ParE family toxin [Inquilinaceae bacterium]
MVWTTEFSDAAERDFELIFDHLFETLVGFGEAPDAAFMKAADRIDAIRSAAEAISKAPHKGTRRDAIATGLRNVTMGRAIVWFDLNEAERKVRILAIFYGGQDHVRHMLTRLLGDDPGV